MNRYIEVSKAMELCNEFYFSEETCSVKGLFDSAPSIDIVRCQDCKYWVYNFNGCSRNPCTEPWYATDFCSYGCRMTNAVVEEKPTPIRDYMVCGERNRSEKPNNSKERSE